ncbi:hypothetical protein [Lacinutrix sp. MEBiC02595]
MKSLKIASIFILSLFVFTITSCDDEPLEGEFTTDGGGAVTCVEATQNLATASATYGTTPTDDVNYAVVCNAYAVALQNMIDACGDESGAIQTLLEALDCPAVSNDCTTAQNATSIAETAYNADNTNATLCNAYEAALQNEIAQCGDADGSLQTIIDGLDCDTTNPTDTLFLKEMIWTETDGTTIYTDTFTYEGNNLISILDSDGYENTYVYENNLLTRINFYESGTLRDYVLIEYNGSNQLISYTIYIILDNEGWRYDLTYNTDGTITQKRYIGDLTSQTNFQSETLVTMGNDQILLENKANGTETVYTYDTKNGIYKNISNLKTLNLINIDFSGYIDGGLNNLVSLAGDYNGSAVVFEEYEYTYNSSNYPATSNDYVEGVLDSTREYIYE